MQMIGGVAYVSGREANATQHAVGLAEARVLFDSADGDTGGSTAGGAEGRMDAVVLLWALVTPD